MVTIGIEDVAPEIHAVLTRRAAAAHQSLQDHLLAWLDDLTTSRTIDEVFESLRDVGGGHLSVETAVDTLQEDRERP